MTNIIFALAFLQPQVVLNGLDPIEFIHGREIAGQPAWSVTVDRHTYRFASEKNFVRFSGDPYAYAVQNGGACGKMGALTGKGDPGRFTVVDGKIFLFASDGCKTGFLADIDSYRKLPKSPQAFSNEERGKAKDLYQLMQRSNGATDGMTDEWVVETQYQSDGVDKISSSSFAFFGDKQFGSWQAWDGRLSYFVQGENKAVEGDGIATYAMHPGEQRAL